MMLDFFGSSEVRSPAMPTRATSTHGKPRHRTPNHRLADLLIPGGVEEFVRSRRSEGYAWRVIARDLWADTGGEVDITHETLRAWFPDDPEEAAS